MTSIERFLNKYNKDTSNHFQNITHTIINNNHYITTKALGGTLILAKAPNLEDLKIMLFIKEDTHQKKDPQYWMHTKDKWFYRVDFLEDLMKYENTTN